jgi:hypothetical protein
MKTNGKMHYLFPLAIFLMSIQAIQLPALLSSASGTSVDEYIEQSNIQSYDVVSTADQAKESRAKFFAEKGNSTLDWTMPSSLSTSGETPQESRNLENNQSSAESANGTSSLQPSNTSYNVQKESSKSITQNASGTWSLRLNDSIQREVALALFQEGNSIYGAGSMRESNKTYELSASGIVQEEAISLDITTQQPIMLYKLSLNLSGDNVSGKYSAVSASGNKWTGDVEGLRLAA